MLAFGRAMIAQPSMILMDEPSLGLAPKVVEEIFGTIRRLNQEDGVSILLVEQNAGVAFSVADYGYIMESGQIVMEGPVETLRGRQGHPQLLSGRGPGRQRARQLPRCQTLQAPQALVELGSGK